MPVAERVRHAGPAWERARRAEAYPVIKTRRSVPGVLGLSRLVGLAALLGLAAIALFLLPGLLEVGERQNGSGGFGGGGGGGPTAGASQTAATPTFAPTPVPAPTAQVYSIKEGDTLSKVAKKFGLTLDQLLEANKDTIENPDRISVGDMIVIPVPLPDEVVGGSAAPEATPDGSPGPSP